MTEYNTSTKELILPDALDFWENRSKKGPGIGKIFKVWRFRYFVLGIFIGIPLALKHFPIGIVYLISLFILDYLILRSRAKERFRLQLNELKIILKHGFYESDKNRLDAYEKDIGKRNLIESNPSNILRKAWIFEIAEKYYRSGDKILDAGCKGGEISGQLSAKSSSIFGTDLNRSALLNFGKRFKGNGVQANILNLPFKRYQFDAILCTEVIEHLFNPIQGLNEIADAMKPGGLLVISTDNRNGIQFLELLNPLIIFERLIGLTFPKVLQPKNIVWKWKEKFKIYHTEYSRTELVNLVKDLGKFNIISYFSSSYLHGIDKQICRLIPNISQEEYLKLIFPIEKVCAKIPGIKWVGDHWIMILRKI
jgi:2-polyprenyl-3-methyl-5-hydroxy-6-metoxy-1,4-benzoquinol methylase